MDYAWPGNVRELENTIIQMAVLSEGDVIIENDIPQEILRATTRVSGKESEVLIPPRGMDLNRYLEELEKTYFQKAIELKKGNQAAAARLLGIQAHTFRKRARERFGL